MHTFVADEKFDQMFKELENDPEYLEELKKIEEDERKTMNTENIRTVGELIDALGEIPQNMRICGSKPNGHDEYDCEERPFWVKRYYDGTEDGVIYIGIDYKHPN